MKVPIMGRNDHIVFVPDHKSFGEFMVSSQMRDPVAEVAHDISVTARGLAKRDNDHKRRVHHYADQFEVRREGGVLTVGKRFKNPRVMVLVVNDDPVALYNEFGNRKTKKLRTLGRAGAMHGDFKSGKDGTL